MTDVNMQPLSYSNIDHHCQCYVLARIHSISSFAHTYGLIYAKQFAHRSMTVDVSDVI